ncbi:hypothetical protein [Erwinia phyllosphaerae]|uniref:hypothetical protein n=1 Tax=Erwinia phyllosphaerae TaxID=2853256 RepID=UPI001FF030C8|nr:hypothetical protein [Erwinia phyllosphaerae]MBV4366503.1 hypothetical protein [Erwinia phyllosphaerae]
MRVVVFAALLAMASLSGCDEESPLSDTDLVPCDFDVMLNNHVQGQSAQEMVDECNMLVTYLERQPTLKLLKETSIANVAFQMKGYNAGLSHTTDRLLQISKLRGQLGNGDDAIINNYNIAFKMYSAWNGEVTPDTIYGFLSHYGELSRKLSDDSFVHMMAVTRLMNN